VLKLPTELMKLVISNQNIPNHW